MHHLQGNLGKAIGARDKASVQLKYFGQEDVYLAYLYHDIAVLYARVNHKKITPLLTKAITIHSFFGLRSTLSKYPRYIAMGFISEATLIPMYCTWYLLK